MIIEAAPALATLHETPSAEAACLLNSMQEYLKRRLNSSACHAKLGQSADLNVCLSSLTVLDEQTLCTLLMREDFDSPADPGEEDLLKVALGWVERPYRSCDSIDRVLSCIYFAGLPTTTLMYLYENWSGQELCEQLARVANKSEYVTEQMALALERQCR